MARYRKIKDGELVIIPADLKQRVACCDCGLIHRYEYSVLVTGNAAMKLPQAKFLAMTRALKLRVAKRVWRDDRATTARRRSLGKKS